MLHRGGELVVGKGASQRAYDVRPSPAQDGRGHIIATIVVLHDVTEHKRTAAALQAQKQLLENLKEEAEAANRSKSAFISVVSHELKTPMTAIRGYAELIAMGIDGPVSEGQQQWLAVIKSNVDMMTAIVGDLAALSRIESGQLALDQQSLAFGDVLAQALRTMRGQIDAKSQAVLIELPDELPPVWADQTRLVQILVNLLSNAHKYTPSDGQIVVRAAVEREVGSAQSIVQLSVQDSGIGISEEDQAHLFQTFFRSEDPAARGAPGTGLGLSITKNLVELHGGYIWCESTFREGTTFHFTLPAAATTFAEPVLIERCWPPEA